MAGGTFSRDSTTSSRSLTRLLSIPRPSRDDGGQAVVTFGRAGAIVLGNQAADQYERKGVEKESRIPGRAGGSFETDLVTIRTDCSRLLGEARRPVIDGGRRVSSIFRGRRSAPHHHQCGSPSSLSVVSDDQPVFPQFNIIAARAEELIAAQPEKRDVTDDRSSK